MLGHRSQHYPWPDRCLPGAKRDAGKDGGPHLPRTSSAARSAWGNSMLSFIVDPELLGHRGGNRSEDLGSGQSPQIALEGAISAPDDKLFAQMLSKFDLDSHRQCWSYPLMWPVMNKKSNYATQLLKAGVNKKKVRVKGSGLNRPGHVFLNSAAAFTQIFDPGSGGRL